LFDLKLVETTTVQSFQRSLQASAKVAATLALTRGRRCSLSVLAHDFSITCELAIEACS
jgi:hypothetical protein